MPERRSPPRVDAVAPHRFPNHCKHLFPSSTHRVQLLFSGGITSDGVHSFWPSMANPPVVPLDSALQPLSAASVLEDDDSTKKHEIFQLNNVVYSPTTAPMLTSQRVIMLKHPLIHLNAR